MTIRNTTGLFLLLPFLFSAPGCKSSEEKKRDEAAEAFSDATRQLAKAAEKLASDRAARGVESGAQGAEKAAAGMQNAAQAMKNWAKAMHGTAPGDGTANTAAAVTEPVNFRDLKALLPETVGDLKRTASSGEKSGVAGMTIAQAKASYEGDGGKQLNIKIIDTGGAVSPIAIAAFGLAMVEIDREDDNGYERTSKVNGFKAFEKWHNKTERGEYKVLVVDRFIVEIEGKKITMETLKSTAAGLDLGKLAALGK
jgi:hypothetical protein